MDLAAVQPGCVTFSEVSSVAKQRTVEDCPTPELCLPSLKRG